MINRKSRDEIKRMRHAGHIVALVHQEMKKVVEPGISTKELDNIAMKVIKSNKAIPTFLGYNGFPASICTSINEQVVHGIPSDEIILKEGDIIAIDVGATYGGMVGDSAWSYAVGKISPEKERLMKVTEESLFAGIANMRAGNVLDDISGGIEDVANREKLGIAIGIRKPGDFMDEQMISDLMAIDYEVNIVHNIQAMSYVKANALLMQQQRQALLTSPSVGVHAQYDAAMQMLDTSDVNAQTLNRYAMTMYLFGDTKEELMAGQEEVERICRFYNVTPVREGWAAQAAFP